MSRAARPGEAGRSFPQDADMGRDAPHGKSFLAEALTDMKTLLHPKKISGNFLFFPLRAGYYLTRPKAPQKSSEVFSLKRREGKRQSSSCGLCWVRSARISSLQSLHWSSDSQIPTRLRVMRWKRLGSPAEMNCTALRGFFGDSKAWTRCGDGEESEQGLPAHFTANQSPGRGRDWL